MLTRPGRVLVIAALAVGVAPAAAQTPEAPPTELTADVSIDPNSGGTVENPVGFELDARIRLTTPGDGEKPIVERFRILLPKQARFNGGRYRKCGLQTLARRGLDGCPRTSIMGSGTATALADTVRTDPQLTVVNVSQRQLCLWTVLTNPARVSACIVVDVQRRTGKWSYELDGTVPENLRVVAGVPIAVQTIDLRAGHKPWAREWLAGTTCPRSGRVPYRAEVDLSTGATSRLDGFVACSNRRR